MHVGAPAVGPAAPSGSNRSVDSGSSGKSIGIVTRGTPSMKLSANIAAVGKNGLTHGYSRGHGKTKTLVTVRVYANEPSPGYGYAIGVCTSCE
jgi:hypothetical protein